MTIYQPNDDVQPTGEEAGEYVDPDGAGIRFPTPSRERSTGDGNPDDRRDAEPSDAKLCSTVPLEGEDGETSVIRQQNVGPGNEDGGGELPVAHTVPQVQQPESSEVARRREEVRRGHERAGRLRDGPGPQPRARRDRLDAPVAVRQRPAVHLAHERRPRCTTSSAFVAP